MPQDQDPLARARSLHREHLSLASPEAEQRVHACVTCGARTFGPTAPCTLCNGPVCGPDLDRAARGDDARASRAAGIRQNARRFTIALVAAIWFSVVVRVLVALSYSVIGAFVVAVVWTLGAVVLTIGTMLLARKFVEIATAPPPAAPPGPSIVDAEERLLLPFLSRNGIDGPRGGAALPPIPDSELDLLAQALQAAGHELTRPWLRVVLVATLLRRDLKALEKQITETAALPRGGDRTRARRALLEGYVLAFPELGREGASRPLLRHLLAERGLDADESRLGPELDELRRELKLKGFLTDLEERRRTGGVRVTVETLDALAAPAFAGILDMVHESLGWRATPEDGATLLEKLGDRAVLVARGSSVPLAASVVNDVLAVRERVGCAHAILATNASLAPDALALAESRGVQVVDRAALRNLLASFERSPKDYDRLAELVRPR